MDADDLARGRALEAAATPGPWSDEVSYHRSDLFSVICASDGEPLLTGVSKNKHQANEGMNAAFIVWLVNHAAALLDAAERAARQVAAAREALAVMEYDHAVTGDVDHATNEAARLLRAALEQPKGDGGE